MDGLGPMDGLRAPVEWFKQKVQRGVQFVLQPKVDGVHSRFGHPWLTPALWKIFRLSMAKRTDVILRYPEHYLSASFEVFLFTMALVWIVTAAANPDIIASNRIHDIFSYNNVSDPYDGPMTCPPRVAPFCVPSPFNTALSSPFQM